MDQLMQIILAVPNSKIIIFLELLSALLNEKQKDIIKSILLTAARENNLPDDISELMSDPLIVPIDRINKNMLEIWKRNTKDSLSEDERLDISVGLFQERVKDEKTTIILLKKLEELMDIYNQFQFSYVANTLTSIFSAISFALDQSKKVKPSLPIRESKEKDLVLANVIKEFQTKDQAESKKEIQEAINQAIKKYQVFASLFEGNSKTTIFCLCELDYEIKLYKKALEAFIEIETTKTKIIDSTFLETSLGEKTVKYYLSMKGDSEQKENPIRKMIEDNPTIQHLLNLYETALVFKGALYDTGKNASQRMEMISQIFSDQQKKLGTIGDVAVDSTTQIFIANMQTIISKNKMLSFTTGKQNRWRLTVFAEKALSYIPIRYPTFASKTTKVSI